ncbi:MAG: hypothetical protein AAF577_06400 [Pseudomonadota bacterium]
MRLTRAPMLFATVLLAACAGRSPDLVEVVQEEDRRLSCFQIEAELEANNRQMADLAGEESAKVAQNVAAGVAGLLIWPLWFAMDFQDAAGKEGSALAARNRYLAELYGRRCDAGALASAPGGGVGTVGTSISAGALPDIGGPIPYEGTRLSDFTRDEIQAYCAVEWTSRRGPDGRTLYNPCRKPTVFR